jgi:hypothetical protein
MGYSVNPTQFDIAVGLYSILQWSARGVYALYVSSVAPDARARRQYGIARWCSPVDCSQPGVRARCHAVHAGLSCSLVARAVAHGSNGPGRARRAPVDGIQQMSGGSYLLSAI